MTGGFLCKNVQEWQAIEKHIASLSARLKKVWHAFSYAF
jgi:hypothetical protein